VIENSKKVGSAALIAAALAMPAEGLRQAAYRDPVGIPTVCFGSTHGVKMGDHHTVEECKQMLTTEMLASVEDVDHCQPGLPANVLAAFSDARYNMGPTVACDVEHSTAAKLLKAGRYAEACKQLLKWDKARIAGQMVSLPGLTKRREAEVTVCLGDES
jgi:GH24 family phage-related lysozyme (muramidase)